MAHQFITCEVKDKIAYVTINREKALNALNLVVIGEIRAVFNDILATEAQVVIFTGAGRSFIAGADIAEMAALPGHQGRDHDKVGMDLMDFIENYRLPVIAAVNGFALGGGCELCMACDFRIASSKAKFGQPELNLGIVPGFGGTQRLPRLVGKGLAKYLIMTGDMIDAAEAYRIGLVQKVVEPEQLMEEAAKIAKTIISKAPIAVRMTKCAVNVAQNTDLPSGIAYELEAFQTTFNSLDRVEGMKAFVEKRAAAFQNK
jgi:enoyl-CoA hydratase